jgi:NAD(P)-dependent dehydrogenase (short-subunit alcohol dehydrogenase family)
VKGIREAGGKVTGIRGDSTKLEELDAMHAQIKEEQGRLHVLFAKASGGSVLPLGNLQHHGRALRQHFQSQREGVPFTEQKALPLLAKVVQVILTGSTVGSAGSAAFSVYSAWKATYAHSHASGFSNLRTAYPRDTISPGAIRTPALIDLAGNNSTQRQGLAGYLAAQIPKERLGEAGGIVSAAMFLASDDASFLNRIVLFDDGGQQQF